MIDSVVGVILAGGKGTRMGRDKARLPYHGKNLIDAPIATLSRIFSTVLLSVRQSDDFPEYDLIKVTDLYPGIGPMGGITSVLASGVERIFCVACDMPFLNEQFIQYLCSFSDRDAVIPLWKGRAEVMHAAYSSHLLPSFQASVRTGRYKITDALPSGAVRYIDEEEIRSFDPTGETFRNVNSPADYEKL